MKPDIKAQWVTALRSGHYKQGHGFLRQPDDYDAQTEPDRFCCLGVLCDLYAQMHPNDGHWHRDAAAISFVVPSDDPTQAPAAYSGYLPASVSAWAGLIEGDPVITTSSSIIHGTPTTLNSRLTHLNDSGRSFATIADYIEEQL